MATEITKKPFDKLKSGIGGKTTGDFGGIFRLPAEFDASKFASAFYPEDEVPNRQQDEPVQGTRFSAPGWDVWKQPDVLGNGKANPNKGKIHTVTTRDRPPVTYTLMCRDIGVQHQINEAYGMLSAERMETEIETSSGVTSEDAGMLSNERLKAEIGAEDTADAESSGRKRQYAPAFHGEQKIKKKSIRVTR